jgi:hypothetical protein
MDKKVVAAVPPKQNSSKMNERTGNLYENKEPPSKTRPQTGNVYESTGLILELRESR